MSWSDLEAGASELAQLGRTRLEHAGLALLATLGSDGAPRIDPVEPHLAGGELLIAAMARTAKARNLGRDPRCALHSLVTDPNGCEGELKLAGRAEPVPERLRDASPRAWWAGRPAATPTSTRCGWSARSSSSGTRRGE